MVGTFETSSGSLTLLLLQIKTFIFLSPSSLLVIRMNAACRPSIQLVSSAFVPVIAEVDLWRSRETKQDVLQRRLGRAERSIEEQTRNR